MWFHLTPLDPLTGVIQTTSLQSKVNIDLSLAQGIDIDFEFTKRKFFEFEIGHNCIDGKCKSMRSEKLLRHLVPSLP